MAFFPSAACGDVFLSYVYCQTSNRLAKSTYPADRLAVDLNDRKGTTAKVQIEGASHVKMATKYTRINIGAREKMAAWWHQMSIWLGRRLLP